MSCGAQLPRQYSS